MATISDMIKIQLGLETAEFNKSLQKSKENIQKTSSELAKGADQVAGKAIGQIAGIARMVAAPLAGAMSIGSMIKSYFGGVAQVAQMTGAYSPKLDEWRKKRALLNRVTREDIQLYKKSREAMTKFQITMADLSAKIMRQTSPAVKFLAEMLTKVSDWVDAHSNDIVRFITVVASLIGTALIPKLLKMAAALALNPITWIVAALIGLAAVIDDLIVWLEGGESALGDFWSMFGSREEVLEKIQKAIRWVTETFQELWESIKSGFSAAITWLDEFWTACSGTDRVLDALREAFGSVMQTLEDMGVIWDYLVELFKDNGFLDDLGQAFDGALSFIIGLFRGFFAGIQAIFGLIKGLLTGDWGSFNAAVEKAIDAAKDAFEGLWKAVKAILNQIWEFAKDIFSMIGDAIKNTLSIDVDKWTQKLNPMNWFKSDAPEVKSDAPEVKSDAPEVMNERTQKLNPMNWFSGDDDKKKENDAGTDSRAESVAQTQTPPRDVFSDLSQMQNSGQAAERNVVNNSSNSNHTTIDSHANVTINTNNPAVAQAAVEQVAPGSGSNYVDQSALAVS